MRFIIISTLFIIPLVLSVLNGIPILYSLLFGLVLFTYDAYKKKFNTKEILVMYKNGFSIVKNLVIVFTLIGMVTSAWRLSGTIPYLVYYGASFINKNLFYLFCFLLNVVMSLLLGSINGTTTTMGVVLISLARANGADLLISTGAILSGAIFGDRISPVSSSALLVSNLTNTDMADNRKEMARTAIVPTILTSIFFLLLSLYGPKNEVNINLLNDLKTLVNFSLICIIPAIAIFILAAFKINTRGLLVVSISISMIIAYFYQNYSVSEILIGLVFGVDIEGTSFEVGRVVNGGGIVSMMFTILNVIVSAIYFGVFEKTKFLEPIENFGRKLEKKIGYYLVLVIMSFIFSIVFCTQSIVVILLAQMYSDRIRLNKKEFMLDLENSPIVIPSLIPWNMAANVAWSHILQFFITFFLYF